MINKVRQFLSSKGTWVDGMWLSAEQLALLTAILRGGALRSHRDLEGNKAYLLHGLSDTPQPVPRKTVLDLRHKRLLETNHKFPSATFLLTERGRAIAVQKSDNLSNNPVTARRFVSRE